MPVVAGPRCPALLSFLVVSGNVRLGLLRIFLKLLLLDFLSVSHEQLLTLSVHVSDP